MYNCGHCSLCRERKRKQWASRLECEQIYSKSSYFVTLTYSDEFLPRFGEYPNLSKTHYRSFLKMLRQKLPFPIRFFGCGEYGSESGRSHYHFVFFLPEYMNRSVFRNIVTSVWKYGYNTVKTANVQRFYYIAKYCCKDTAKPCLGCVDGFQTMSQNPPLGYRHFIANKDVISELNCNYFTSPSFRKSSLPRSWQQRIYKELDDIPCGSVSQYPLSSIRRNLLANQSGLLLKQYVIDYNSLTPKVFNDMVSEIERRINKNKYKPNQI